MNTFLFIYSNEWNHRKSTCGTFNFTYFAVNTMCRFINNSLEKTYENNIRKTIPYLDFNQTCILVDR